jgi:hypothetical protein
VDFRAQYLQAMREQAPDLFKGLSARGELEQEAKLAVQEAVRLFHELTKEGPKDEDRRPTMQASREAEERVRAELFNFQRAETSVEQDERDYLLVGDRPLLSPDGLT